MGEVYRARDMRLERKWRSSFSPVTGRWPERLLREARHASALNHPNICTLHEKTDRPRPFLVMELVDGEPLDRRLRGGGLAVPEATRIAAQIADALAHAHGRGIVHRDLKSANVVITREGRPKILDFGIARRISTADLAAATVSVQTLTADYEIAGTLPYMAPEVLDGRPADLRSDLWALGVMLAEMISGARPFDGSTAMSLSTAIMRDDRDCHPTCRRRSRMWSALCWRRTRRDATSRPPRCPPRCGGPRQVTSHLLVSPRGQAWIAVIALGVLAIAVQCVGSRTVVAVRSRRHKPSIRLPYFHYRTCRRPSCSSTSRTA